MNRNLFLRGRFLREFNVHRLISFDAMLVQDVLVELTIIKKWFWLDHIRKFLMNFKC